MVLLGEEGPEYELSGNALAATYASTGAALAPRQCISVYRTDRRTSHQMQLKRLNALVALS